MTPPIEPFQIAGVNTAHAVAGDGPDVLLLHGWGANLELMWPLAEKLATKGCRVHAIDLPGFGRADLPPTPWSVRDYVSFVLAYLQKQKIGRVRLIGHSFGGRLSIVLGAEHADHVEKIVLCNSAGVKTETPWYRRLPAQLYHLVETRVDSESPPGQWMEQLRTAYRNRVGSEDYLRAGALKETFLKVVDEDLLPIAGHISRPTLLIWGDQDTDTPLWQAQKLESTIPDAGLVVFPGAGHYSYLDALPDAVRVIDYFFKQP